MEADAMESQPMKASEYGKYVCVAHGGCLHTPRRTIDAAGVWVRSPDPDPLNPGNHLYSSAHRDCFDAWQAREANTLRYDDWNHETKSVRLVIDNDRGYRPVVMAAAVEILASAGDDAMPRMWDWLKDYTETDLTPGADDLAGLTSALYAAAFARIDWRALAESYLDRARSEPE